MNAFNRTQAAKYLGLKYSTLKKRTDIYPPSYKDRRGHNWYLVSDLNEMKLLRSKRQLRVDLTGKRYGRLYVLAPVPVRKHENTRYSCLCDCGNTAIVIGSELQRQRTKSCGCLASDVTSANSLVDLKGTAFGRLVVLARQGSYGTQATWLCLCECGKEIIVTGGNLRSGNTQSCGCFQADWARDNATHLHARMELSHMDVSIDELVNRLHLLFC